MAGGEPEKGDKVSWNWGGGAPGGTVAETKTEGELAIKSKRGNTIKKNADPSNPAVHIERSGNDVVKRASELNVEKKASGGGSATKKRDHEDAEGGTEENAEGKEIKAGGGKNKKAKREEPKKEDKKDEVAKETKAEVNGEKKKAGRPKKAEGQGASKSKEKKATKPRSTETVSARTRSQGK